MAFLRANVCSDAAAVTVVPGLSRGLSMLHAVPESRTRRSAVDQRRTYEVTGPDALTFAEATAIISQATGHRSPTKGYQTTTESPANA